ncbi:MAG TPA: hypothetical protein EYG21_07570 [Nitrospinaceae bacterium]|nr:hypothetical protein [Nitrospinaceae bacterium]
MKTFNQHLAEGGSQTARTDDFEAEIVAVLTHQINKTKGNVLIKKLKIPLTKERREVCENIIKNLEKRGMKIKSKLPKHLGSKNAPTSAFFKSRTGKSSDRSKTDMILGGDAVSLKMHKRFEADYSAKGGQYANNWSGPLFEISMVGPEKVKPGAKKAMKEFTEFYYKHMLPLDTVKTPSPRMAAKDLEGMPALVRKTDMTAKKKGQGPYRKELEEILAATTNDTWKKYKSLKKQMTKKLSVTLSKDKMLRYNIAYNEVSGSVKFGTGAPNGKYDGQPDAVATYLIDGSKIDGSLLVFGDLRKKAFMSKIANGSVITVEFRTKIQPDQAMDKKTGKVSIPIISRSDIDINFKKAFESADNFVVNQIANLDMKMLTEGQIWDKVKDIYSKVEDYLTRIWKRLVDWVGDSWERLLLAFDLEPVLTVKIKI